MMPLRNIKPPENPPSPERRPTKRFQKRSRKAKVTTAVTQAPANTTGVRLDRMPSGFMSLQKEVKKAKTGSE
jgi:hypothetical protein